MTEGSARRARGCVTDKVLRAAHKAALAASLIAPMLVNSGPARAGEPAPADPKSAPTASPKAPTTAAPKAPTSADPKAPPTATADPKAATDGATKTDEHDAASAESIAQEHRKRAREKGTAALKLFRASQFDDAYPLFREADEEWHTLPLVLYMARCQGKRGKLLEARALYERVLAEAVMDNPSESILTARNAASEELGELRLRISTLAIDVRGPPPEEVTLFLDGEVWPIAEPRELDPGSHEVEAIARSGARTGRTVEVPPGRAISTVLRLGLFAPSASRALSTPDQPEAPTWPMIAAGVAFGVGGLGLGVGSVTGFLVLGQGSSLARECGDRACSPSQREDLHALQALGDVSTASFILGGVGAAAGAAFLIFGRPSSKTGAPAAAVFALPGALAVAGTF